MLLIWEQEKVSYLWTSISSVEYSICHVAAQHVTWCLIGFVSGHMVALGDTQNYIHDKWMCEKYSDTAAVIISGFHKISASKPLGILSCKCMGYSPKYRVLWGCSKLQVHQAPVILITSIRDKDDWSLRLKGQLAVKMVCVCARACMIAKTFLSSFCVTGSAVTLTLSPFYFVTSKGLRLHSHWHKYEYMYVCPSRNYSYYS